MRQDIPQHLNTIPTLDSESLRNCWETLMFMKQEARNAQGDVPPWLITCIELVEAKAEEEEVTLP
jgi:hypothetical protein